jgi:hypothetical protein
LPRNDELKPQLSPKEAGQSPRPRRTEQKELEPTQHSRGSAATRTLGQTNPALPTYSPKRDLSPAEAGATLTQRMIVWEEREGLGFLQMLRAMRPAALPEAD